MQKGRDSSKWVNVSWCHPQSYNPSIIRASNHPIIHLFWGTLGTPWKINMLPVQIPHEKKGKWIWTKPPWFCSMLKPTKKIIQSFNHPIIQSSNHPIFGGGILPQSSQSSFSPADRSAGVSAPWPHLPRSWLQFSPTRPVDGQVGLKPKVAPDACALPSKYDMLMLLMDD